MIADLSALDTLRPAEEGRWFDLLHPATGKPIPLDDGARVARIQVKGMASETAQTFMAQQLDRSLRGNRRGEETVTADSLREQQTELLARCTIGWELPPLDGKPLVFSINAARQLYGDMRFSWIRKQVDEAINDPRPFLAAIQSDSRAT